MKNSVLTLLSFLIFITTSFAGKEDSLQIAKFGQLLQHIDKYYVDSTSSEDLVEIAIRKMLKELDPHSVYIAAEDLAKANEGLKGEFEGIGIQFNIFKDTIMVVAPIIGGPSEKLGILAGDRICIIDGENVAGVGIKNDGVGERLRGKKGTKVTVQIKRRGVEELLEYEIIRDKIPINSRDAAYMATDEIGYIKLNKFAATTMKEYKEAMNDLYTQGMKHLILDLRGNTGGYLYVAEALANEFLEKDKLIVYTEGRSFDRKDTKSNAIGSFKQGKLVVLVNQGSASASEIVSGAIQDNDRGIIVGRRTFGKGLVQKPYNLPDGSIVRLTIQRYYSPSGRCIQKPYEEYKDDYQKRMERGEFFSSDSIDFPDSLKFKTLNGRTVYGGGGIMPDVFVPIDTTMNSDYYSNLLRKSVFNQFTLDYMDKNREELLQKYPNVKVFNKEFKISDELFDDFKEYGNKKGAEFDENDFKTSEEQILNLLKASIARNLWDINAYFQVYNEINPDYIKAIEVIEGNTFKELNISY